MEEAPLWRDKALIYVLDTDRSPLNVGIPLVFMVESAFAKQHLIFTIPWIVELFQMARWSRTAL